MALSELNQRVVRMLLSLVLVEWNR